MSATVIMTDLDIWECQAHETAKQFHAFCHYRDMSVGNRSIDKAYRLHMVECKKTEAKGGTRAKQWQAWAAPWQWVQRVEAWDRESERAIREKLAKDRQDSAIRHARMAQTNLQALIVPGRVLLEALQSDPTLLQRMVQQAKESVGGARAFFSMACEAARAMQSQVEVERLSLGMNTELIEVDVKREHAFGNLIAADPVATELAIALLDRIAGTGEVTAPASGELTDQ